MNYPGHIIRKGYSENLIITAIQQKLNKKGCGPIIVNGEVSAGAFAYLIIDHVIQIIEWL